MSMTRRDFLGMGAACAAMTMEPSALRGEEGRTFEDLKMDAMYRFAGEGEGETRYYLPGYEVGRSIWFVMREESGREERMLKMHCILREYTWSEEKYDCRERRIETDREWLLGFWELHKEDTLEDWERRRQEVLWKKLVLLGH